jgi:hypothetical protein
MYLKIVLVVAFAQLSSNWSTVTVYLLDTKRLVTRSRQQFVTELLSKNDWLTKKLTEWTRM